MSNGLPPFVAALELAGLALLEWRILGTRAIAHAPLRGPVLEMSAGLIFAFHPSSMMESCRPGSFVLSFTEISCPFQLGTLVF